MSEIYATQSGMVASDRVRHYCAKCESMEWLEVTTRAGRLVESMQCGHTYDPTAQEPLPDLTPTGPSHECKGGCGNIIFATSQWCRECYEPRRKRLQKEWAARKQAERELERAGAA